MSAVVISRARFSLSLCVAVFHCISSAKAEPKSDIPTPRTVPHSADEQARLDGALARMLSGATLEGSFTVTDGGKLPDKLSKEKYTLGDVKKIAGDLWQIPARIQYGEKDVTLPIVLPIKWADDTPMVVVDSLPLPGFGTVSARVMFFENHYAGYWKHGDHGGHLFGVIHPAKKAAADSTPSPNRP